MVVVVLHGARTRGFDVWEYGIGDDDGEVEVEFSRLYVCSVRKGRRKKNSREWDGAGVMVGLAGTGWGACMWNRLTRRM